MSDRTLFRLGSVAAVAGAVLALVTNAIHPRPSDYGDHVTAELRMVAGSDGWILIHLGLLAGVLLIGFGLFAVARSVKDGPAEGAARVAIGVLLVSIPVAVVQLAVDGYATKAVADAWSRATGAEQATLVAAGTAVAEVGWALFMMLALTVVGLVPIAFGWAVATSGRYPAALGWPVAVAGAGSVVASMLGVVGGPSATFFVLFIVTSALATLWVLAMGIALWRRADQPAPAPQVDAMPA
jgi:hypothetical protein